MVDLREPELGREGAGVIFVGAEKPAVCLRRLVGPVEEKEILGFQVAHVAGQGLVRFGEAREEVVGDIVAVPVG